MSSRQAALLMHALSPSDRDWVLQRLGAAEGEQMRELLAELESLGIPEDTALVDAALDSPSAAPSRSMPDDDETLLMQADATVLAQVLRAESTSFVRKLLAAGDWPWADELASQLSLPSSGKVAPQPAVAFRQCATRLIARRLRENGTQTPARDMPTAAARTPARWIDHLGTLWRRPA